MVKQGDAQRLVTESQCFICLKTDVPIVFSRVLNGDICYGCTLDIADMIMKYVLEPTTDQYGKQRGGYHRGTPRT
jgi:hypothetical protein